MKDITGKKVAILGAGVEGLSSAEWFVKHGAIVTLRDRQEGLGGSHINEMLQEGVKVITGEQYLEGLEEYDILVRSPGIKPNLPEITAAVAKGVVLTSQTKLFFEYSPAPIIGVTGTKGKGTTASLIYEMIKEEGLDVYLGGNIGVPPLTFLDKLTPQSWVVLELSSFQLEDLQKSPTDATVLTGKPHIAVMLMIVPEHLGKDTVGTQNYHETMEEYVDAKRNIVRWQKKDDFTILNRDYIPSLESDVHTEGEIFQITRETEVEKGCFIRQGRLLVKRDGKEQEIMPIADVLLPGNHNWENICAATMSATLAGISKKSIASVLTTFKGLEHRLELIREVRSVRYYDDSFSTTPETAMAAIEAFDAPEILILGGSSKGSDFTMLGKVIREKRQVKAIIGIGAEWERMKAVLRLEDSKVEIVEGLQSMDEIVKRAAALAKPGDVVLLTPACASFGMFKNYKERGELFKKAVEQL